MLPNPIRLDTAPPRVFVVSTGPRTISPDGDGHGDRIVVRYRLSQPAQAMLLVNGVRRVLARSAQVAGELRWYGQAHGRPLKVGTYGLTVVAKDPAGNRSAPVSAGTVRIRYLALGKAVYRARPGGPIRVALSTDAHRVSWLLAGRRGTGRPPLLRLRAPATPGSYTLYVRANHHAARARVVVVP